MKTSELIGPDLDWAVAKCEGLELRHFSEKYGCIKDHQCEDDVPGTPGYEWSPSTDWAQGGPIIEREKIDISYWISGNAWHGACPGSMRYDYEGEYIDGSDGHSDGPTPLVAAMRCYVASTLGEEVDVPEELL